MNADLEYVIEKLVMNICIYKYLFVVKLMFFFYPRCGCIIFSYTKLKNGQTYFKNFFDILGVKEQSKLIIYQKLFMCIINKF